VIVKDDLSIIQSYLEDSSNTPGGHADKVIIPENIDEVSAALKKSHADKTPVTVSGAGTGQAGGRIPFGGIVISTEKLTKIKEIEKIGEKGYAIVEAGVLIKDLKASCERKGLFYTYDPTEQTAFAGGMIATNASGARSFRYGPTRKYVLALTLILADGEVFHLKRGDVKAKARTIKFKTKKKDYKIDLPDYTMPATKNSAGYYAKDNMDLIDLFIGQEGTLGIIAEAKLGLIKMPKEFLSVFAFFKNEEKALNFTRDARNARPASIEYFDKNTLALLSEKYPNVPKDREAGIFFEDEIRATEDEAVGKWEKIFSRHGISLDDTQVAMNEKTRREFMEKRQFIPERMSEMAKHSGFPKVSTDLAVPENKNEEMLRHYRETLKLAPFLYFIFGHIGDSHMHVNMLPGNKKEYDVARRMQLDFVKKSVSLGGTVSAEHGIGKAKKDFLKLLYGEKGIREMIRVKCALDAKLILGRGNIFDFF